MQNMVFLNPLVWLLAAFQILSEINGQFSRSEFWDQFPDMWRGVASRSANSPVDVQRQSRFEDWRNGVHAPEPSTSSGSVRIHDLIRSLFSHTGNGLDDMRTAMTSVGAIGNIQPQMGRGRFSFSNLFPEFKAPTTPQDWWNGPNVCVERTEEDLKGNSTGTTENTTTSTSLFDHSMHINSCTKSPENDAYACVTEIKRPDLHRKYTVKYSCCYGFTRDGDTLGCTKVIPMTTILDTLNSLKLTDLVQSLKESGLSSLLEAGNFTIFAPTNEAFEDYKRSDNEISPRKPQDLRTVIRSHIVSGLVRSADFTDEETVSSLSSSSIRINLFSTPGHILTADCARVVSLNNLAKNGVVHIVDRVIQPVTMTLEASLRADGRFGTLLQLLDDAGLMDTLRDTRGHATVMAPTDEAFRLMDRDIRNRLSADNICLKSVLQSHILPNVICSAVIERNALTSNVLHKAIHFDRDMDRLSVENHTIISADNMASNGMYHVLNGVIIPEEAKSLRHIATDAGMDGFMNLVDQAGLGAHLDSLRNLTIFIPSNRAVEKLSTELRSNAQNSSKYIADLVNFHIVQPAVLLSGFKDNLEMDSALTGQSLRLNVYEVFPFGKSVITVNCAKVTVANLRGCDGAVHILDRVLFPPNGDIIKVLTTAGNFTQFVTALRTTGLEHTLLGNGPVTVFAPTDAAFALLPPEDLQQLLSQVCCAGIMEDSLFFGQYSRSMNPSYSLPLHRTRYGQIKIAGAVVQKCDVMATNGIVHYIDKVLFPKNFL